MPKNWLDLLLAGVSVDSIYRRRDELVRAGVDAGHAERHAGRGGSAARAARRAASPPQITAAQTTFAHSPSNSER
jgi:hypothetical protein